MMGKKLFFIVKSYLSNDRPIGFCRSFEIRKFELDFLYEKIITSIVKFFFRNDHQYDLQESRLLKNFILINSIALHNGNQFILLVKIVLLIRVATRRLNITCTSIKCFLWNLKNISIVFFEINKMTLHCFCNMCVSLYVVYL